MTWTVEKIEQVDAVARTLFDHRSMRRTPCTDEEWDNHSQKFKTTHNMLIQDAIDLIESGELELD